MTKSKTHMFANLPTESDHTVLPEIQAYLKARPTKLVVLDDDPTGTQTVYAVPILTTWAVKDLQIEFEKSSGDTFYILTNSRSLAPDNARAVNIEIAKNLLQAADGKPFHIVSRSDSTLRGHFPLEPRALSDGLGITFDAWLLIPFFEEGGRLTIDSIHYVVEGDKLLPASDTVFAQDVNFGYTTSVMRDWVAEKMDGQIEASEVIEVSLDDIRNKGVDGIYDKLMKLHDEAICVFDAISYRDLELITLAILRAEECGKQFLYRTAASFVRTRAGLDSHPLLNATDLNIESNLGGLVVVGSYISKTTKQLANTLDTLAVATVELQVDQLLADASNVYIQTLAKTLIEKLCRNKTVILFTSRDLVVGVDAGASLYIGNRVSNALVQILNILSQRPAFIIAKGGITSSDIATKALGVRRAIVRGQIDPGIPVWELDENSRFPDLPYIIFPGNVGDDTTLSHVIKKLTI